MAYVGIDTRGARTLGLTLQDMAGRTDLARRDVSVALNMADLASQVLLEMSVVQDGFGTIGASVIDKAALAERFAADPKGTAAKLGAPVEAIRSGLTALLGFAVPRDLRGILVGLPAAGADPALDAVLARSDLASLSLPELQLLAVRLGINHAGPPTQPPGRAGTEVFWNDFWSDGRTVDEVLADPQRLLQWVAGTVELDRRLGLATELPRLGDVLATVDFVAGGGGNVDQIAADAEVEFAAIADFLPAVLVGTVHTAPTTDQVAQTLAFATRVGWTGFAGTSEQQFDDAIAFMRANRVLQSSLLATGFEGDPNPLAFFNGPGIAQLLALGRRTGVLDDTYLGGLAGGVDRTLAGLGVNMSGPTPVELTEPLQAQLFALVASQIPRSLAQSPAIQAQFIAALGYLRQATTGPEQRQRLLDVIAGFRTLGVTGAPALTERQLVAAVGTRVVDVLGRSRLRLRSQSAIAKHPEFFLVARQWGVPGGHTQKIGKYKFSWGFDDLGVLTTLRRKKRSWLSRAFDTIKAIGQAIWDSWEKNPLTAIFQVGKLALGALSFVVPGLGVAAFALGLAETAFHAVQGDWMSAIGAGLSAFTAGATDIFGAGIPTALQEAQHAVVQGLLGTDALSVLKDVKRVFDIGSSVVRFLDADSLVGSIGAGLGAASTVLGSGGQLLGAPDLTRLGTTLRDLTGVVAPVAGLAEALRGNNPLLAFANGLGVISAGTRALANPLGAFANTELKIISQGTGIAGLVARAIDAADNGDAFRAGSSLAQAIQLVHDPNRTVIGDRAQIAQRIGDIGALLQSALGSANPEAAGRLIAPTVMTQLGLLVDAVSTPPKV